jgi:glycosyltransferase involved in cell wall biosynthesis
MNTLSVVIPTYNRCQTLERAMRGYMEQTAFQRIAEILVVDDGSTDATGEVVSRVSQESSVAIRYFRQENKGPAAARNLGIREASSELILFTDDDIIPGPTLVAEHLEWHAQHPAREVVVLGNVDWDPNVGPTPFMEWYGSDGALFAYGHFHGKTDLDYMDFYTCNLSLKVQFLRDHGTFDEDFKTAAYEDIELAYRLRKVGMRLMYNSKAKAYHSQYISFDDACRRARKAVSARETFKQKEAGQYYYSFQPGTPASRLKRYLAWPLGLLLAPLKIFVDGRMKLPKGFYWMMLRVYR